MSRKLVVWFVFLGCIIALGWWIHRIGTQPAQVVFARASRQTLVSAVTTNGKVEPYVWTAVRAERQGLVDKVDVVRGQQVARGALLVEMDTSEARAELASADAQVAQARAQLETLKNGGPPVERADIESQLERARMDLRVAERDYASLQRLAQKQAATQQEVFDAHERVQKAQQQIQALEQKRAALVSHADNAAAEARLSQALAARQTAEGRLRQSVLRAPMAGTVYQLDARPGAYLNPGDMAARIGLLDRLRVTVYVDEPELGRIAEGMPVTITWDALPDRRWKGTVERVPTEVVALGSRQVGEVGVVIENPGRELLPGTNVNAEIQSQVVPNACVIPKEALRRRGNQDGVFVLQGDRVFWRPVTLGISSITRVQVLSGVSEGQAVALATELTLQDGERVRPLYQ